MILEAGYSPPEQYPSNLRNADHIHYRRHHPVRKVGSSYILGRLQIAYDKKREKRGCQTGGLQTYSIYQKRHQ